MDDPYQSAESLDPKTLDYVTEQKEKFTRKFGNISEEIKDAVTEYTCTKTVLQALIRGQHVLTVFSEGAEYHVAIDDRTFYSTGNVISWIEASDDSRRVAVFETVGSDKGFLKLFKDSELQKVIEDKISQIVFTGKSHFLVKTFSESPPPDGGEINSHRILRDGEVVFGHEYGSTDFIHAHSEKDRIIIDVGDWNHTVLYAGNLEEPETWKKVKELDSPAIPLGFHGNEICFLEKKDRGIVWIGDRKVIETKQVIEDCVMVEDGFLLFLLSDAKVQPVLYDFDGKQIDEYSLDMPMGLVASDSDSNGAVIVLTSFGIPFSLYVYRNRKFARKEESRVLYPTILEREVKSGDASIHYFLVKSRPVNGKKVLINGYGGFNISLLPGFRPLFAALLKNNISVVVANLRGGGEYGEQWHRDGMREHKQNVFDDFAAVISDLKKDGYRTVAIGQSNGGLLVGSTVAQHPDLLEGALIGVPVLDMLRFHVLSVGKWWTTEYGNPDSQEDAKFLSSYSPYHNISGGEYPPVLIFSRLRDDRVHPAHAIKFHMKLSEHSSKAYLRINPGGGHAGVPQSQRIEEICEEVNFIMSCFS